jgi:DNA-binding NtrC family response regulator
MCGYDDVEAVSERMTLGSCFNVLKPFDTETLNILMHKALQHKSRRVLPEGSSIPKKTQGRKDSSSAKNHRSETEGEEPYVFKAHSSKKLCRFTWTSHLHERFLRAVEVLGECKAIFTWHKSVICYV